MDFEVIQHVHLYSKKHILKTHPTDSEIVQCAEWLGESGGVDLSDDIKDHLEK